MPIGEWVLREACAAAAGWPGDIGVAVNLSPVQFRKNRNLIEHVKAALSSSGLRAGPAGGRDHRVGAAGRQRERAADPAAVEGARRQDRAWTISAPAIRRSAICGASRSTRSRSTSPSCSESSSSAGQPGDRQGGDRPGPQPRHDDNRRGGRNRSPALDDPRAGLHRGPGLPVQPALAAERRGELLSRFGSAGTGSAMRSSDVACVLHADTGFCIWGVFEDVAGGGENGPVVARSRGRVPRGGVARR